MKLLWTERAWEDYLHWRNNDPDSLKKINALIEDIQRLPFRGLGKPEALKFALSGWWSRRITQEHRLSIGYRENLATRSWKLPSAAIIINSRRLRIVRRGGGID